MQLTLNIEIDDSDADRILQCSMARTLSTAVFVGTEAGNSPSFRVSDAGYCLVREAEELKPMATLLWGAARNAIRAVRREGL